MKLTALKFRPERLLLSFHGMPVRTLELGDPYHCHCQKTARLLADSLAAIPELGLSADQVEVDHLAVVDPHQPVQLGPPHPGAGVD